jgi:hypothetical protein
MDEFQNLYDNEGSNADVVSGVASIATRNSQLSIVTGSSSELPLKCFRKLLANDPHSKYTDLNNSKHSSGVILPLSSAKSIKDFLELMKITVGTTLSPSMKGESVSITTGNILKTDNTHEALPDNSISLNEIYRQTGGIHGNIIRWSKGSRIEVPLLQDIDAKTKVLDPLFLVFAAFVEKLPEGTSFKNVDPFSMPAITEERVNSIIQQSVREGFSNPFGHWKNLLNYWIDRGFLKQLPNGDITATVPATLEDFILTQRSGELTLQEKIAFRPLSYQSLGHIVEEKVVEGYAKSVDRSLVLVKRVTSKSIQGVPFSDPSVSTDKVIRFIGEHGFDAVDLQEKKILQVKCYWKSDIRDLTASCRTAFDFIMKEFSTMKITDWKGWSYHVYYLTLRPQHVKNCQIIVDNNSIDIFYHSSWETYELLERKYQMWLDDGPALWPPVFNKKHCESLGLLEQILQNKAKSEMF